MSVNFVWKINELEKKTSTGEVVMLHWHCTGTDEHTKNSARVYGTSALKPADPESPNFISFENLTEEEVINWLLDVIYAEYYKKSICNQIDVLNNPPIVVVTPPWTE